MGSGASIGWRRISLGAAMLLAAAALPGNAEDCAAPCLAYAVSAEFEGDWLFKTHPPENEGSDLEPTVDTEFSFSPADRLKLVSTVTTESVLDRLPGEDRAFSDIGAYVYDLYAALEVNSVTLRWGKFAPVFGLATDELDGIYATDLVAAYDNEERWGAESAVQFEAFGWSHALTASAFTIDRTVLSESLFTNRGRARLSGGGAGNAEGIASLAAVLDGCKGAAPSDCYDDGRFGYRLGIRHQQAGHPSPDQIEHEIPPRDETAFLAASTARFEFGAATLRTLGEVVYFTHFDSEPGDAWFATVSAALETGPLTTMAAYSHQRNLRNDEPDSSEDLFDFTAAYDLGEDFALAGERWTLAAAYGYARNAEGDTAHAIGMTVTIDFDGSVRSSDKQDSNDSK